MASPTRISELAAIISSNTALVNDYFISNNLPTPTLDSTAPAHLPIGADAPHIQAARHAVLNATAELQALMKGPAELLRVASTVQQEKAAIRFERQLTNLQWTDNVSLHAIVRFRIHEAFPVDSTATFAQIASKVGLTERNTRRLIRHAVPNYLFEEPSPGTVKHSGLTRLLAEDENIYNNVRNGLDELWRTAPFAVEALENYPGSEEPQETAFGIANGVGGQKSMWEFYEENPGRGEVFGKGMSGMDKVKGYEPRLLIDGYDWGRLGDGGKVVDVGGSHGTVMINIARAFPQLKFVVQDLPKVVSEGREKLPQDVKGQVEFMEHDFFTPQPVTADVYYMRSILHNWSDKYGIKILQNLVPGLKKGSRILVHELVVPEPGTMSPADEKRLRHLDIGMMQLLNAHQREAREWEILFRSADKRYKFLGIRKPPGAAQSLIEAEWQG